MKIEAGTYFQTISNIGQMSLKYFSVVAQQGSVRAAADTLYITASSLSRQISKVERALKTPLFHRRSDGMQLTEAGRILMACIERMDLDLRASISQINGLTNLTSGEIEVCTVEGMVESFLSREICRFHARHPSISIRVNVMGAVDVTETLVSDKADIGIGFNTPARDDIMIMKSVMQPIRLYCNPTHYDEYAGIGRIEDLPLHRLCMPQRNFWIHRVVNDAFNARKIRLRPHIVSNSLLFLNSVVRDGNYLAFLPRLAAESFSRRSAIAELPLREERLEKTHIDLCIHSNRRLPAAANALLKHLQIHLS
jgi:DNA-binding transcriptional LysR family regulator